MLKLTGTIRRVGIALVLVVLTACGKQSIEEKTGIPGISKYNLQIANGHAILAIIFDNVQIDAGAVIPLQRPKGASIELGPDFESGGSIFKISVPLASLYNNGGGLPLTGLPDGRPIPFIKTGLLGAVAANLPVFGQTYLYLAEDVFGIFIPVKLPDVPVMVHTRIRDEQGNILGILAGIPKGSTGWISGLLFLFPMDGGI